MEDFPVDEIPVAEMIAKAEAGIYKAMPARVFSFEDVPEAHRVIEANQSEGSFQVLIGDLVEGLDQDQAGTSLFAGSNMGGVLSIFVAAAVSNVVDPAGCRWCRARRRSARADAAPQRLAGRLAPPPKAPSFRLPTRTDVSGIAASACEAAIVRTNNLNEREYMQRRLDGLASV